MTAARAEALVRRRKALAAASAASGAGVAVFEDAEGRRDPSIRYFTGHPGDALLFIAADGRSLLVPWDVNMAEAMASVDALVPYTDFKRSPYLAVAGALAKLGAAAGSVVDLPPATPYPMFVEFVAACPDYDFRCVEDGSGKAAERLRSVKDAEEIEAYRAVSRVTDQAIVAIESGVRAGTLRTETDVALFIERFLRERGCESTGFETLAAGPARSFGIHAFPAFTSAPFASPGLSILDFGLVWEGYTSDVTMTFAVGPLSGKQAEMLSLVERAHADAAAMCRPGVRTRDIAAMVDGLFAAAGFSMPHALGHGIGLEAHEAPTLRNREDNDDALAPGNVVTLEPGLYDPALGGARLEDDFLISADGVEKLTNSRIVRL